MGDNIQTAILYTVNLIDGKNIMFLIPQKITIGKCSEKTDFFYSFLDNKEYQNADDAVREENYVCFYDVKTIGELKDYYNTQDLSELFDIYFKDLYSKVYYYELGKEDDFDSYFMKKSSIEDFNEKYDLNFSYHPTENMIEEKEKYQDPLVKNYKLVKQALDKNILFQNEAKNKLLNTLYNNNLLQDTKSNIIISGPSGVGKSETLKLLADNSTQPVLYTKFAPNFIDNVKEYLDSLLLNSYYLGLSKEDNVVSRTIVIDDFDKDFNYSVALEVIDEITKFIKDGKRFVRYSSGSKAGIILDSKDITFIICGNFDKVNREQIIPIDFFKEDNFKIGNTSTCLNKEQLISNYGFYEETLQSFDVHIDFKPLTLEKTKKIITNSNNSLFKLYCKKLKEQGIRLTISDKTIDLISEKVYSKKGNIKNINEIITNMFENLIIASFNLEEGTNIIVDENIVEDKNSYQLKKGSKK